MAANINPPSMPTGTPDTQVQSLYRYLYQLSEQLNMQFSGMQNDKTILEKAIGNAQGASASKVSKDEITAYNQLRTLIIKTATEVTANVRKQVMDITSEYTAQSKFGTYSEFLAEKISAGADGILMEWDSKNSISTSIGDFNEYIASSEVYMRIGIVAVNDDGTVEAGVIIGKEMSKVVIDGNEIITSQNLYVLLKAESLSFWRDGTKLSEYGMYEFWVEKGYIDEVYTSLIQSSDFGSKIVLKDSVLKGIAANIDLSANNTVNITAEKINAIADEIDLSSNRSMKIYVGEKLGDISIGGRNLWLRTREYDPTKYDGWASGGAPYTVIDGFGVQRIAGAWNDISQNVPVEAGAEYTLSAWIKWEDAANTGTFYLFHSGGSVDVTAQVGTTDYVRVSATYVETGSTSSCRFECSTDAPYLIYGLKLEKGNKATDWSPAPEDPVSQLQAESVVEINKNRVKISTPEFAVDIPTTEGMDVQVNEKGFSAPVIVSPTVAKAKPGGVYTVGAGGDYACLADAFGDINDCAISEDVWLRMLDGADAGGLLRGVSGAGQVMIAPANLANFSDTAAWTTQNNVKVNVLGSALGVSISASTTGAWKWAYLHVGRVGPLGLRGKTLTLSADMYSNQNAAGLVMQMIVRLNDKAIRYVTRPNVADLTAPATAVASFTISAEAGFWDELNIVFQLNQGTSVPVGAAAFYYNIRMEPGNAVSDAAAGKCTATIGDLRIEGCAAQVNISEIIFPRALEARQSAAALNRCAFKGADGFRLFGGHGYMENCYGSCSATAVYAGGGGAVQITGSAPSGTKAGLLETSEMDAGDPPTGGMPDPVVSKTITAKATSSGTYDGVNGWWSSDAALRQGYVSGNGRLRGGVWFDLSALPSGATITKLTLRLRRVEGYGKGSAVDVRIYGTTASAKSGDPAASGKISSSYVSGTIEPGKTKTFDVTSLKAYTGFVLYAADNAVLSGKSYSTNFARFTGTGGGDDTIPMLTVTYTG